MTGSWCTITVRATPHPSLRKGTLFLEVADEPMVEAFVRFLRGLPWEDRGWDKPTKRWWVHARHREALCAAAQACYPEAYLIEGRVTVNLGTGEIIEQLELFDGEEEP